MNGLLKVGTLLPQTVVLTGLHLKLFLHVREAIILHVVLGVEMFMVAVLLLQHLFDAVDLHLANVDLVLVLLDLDFGLLVSFLLGLSDAIKLHTHLLDRFGLRMVDIRLARDVLVALLDLGLGSLIFLRHIPLALLGLR